MSLLVILSTYAMEDGQTATSVPHHHSWHRTQAWLKSILESHEDCTSKWQRHCQACQGSRQQWWSGLSDLEHTEHWTANGLITHVLLSRSIARLWPHDSKALERLQVLRSKPSTCISQLTYWPLSWGRLQYPKLGIQLSVLTQDSFIQDSFTEDTLLSVWD